MKSFLIRTLLWLAYFICGTASFMAIATCSSSFERHTFYNESSYGDTYRRMADFEKAESHNGWLFGSSTCYRGINPNYLNKGEISTFNLCSGLQTISGSQAALEWALTKHQKPKFILLDIYPAFWQSSPYEYFLDVATNHQGERDIQFSQFLLQARSPYLFIVSIYHSVKNKIHPHHFNERYDSEYQGNGFTYSIAAPFTSPPCEIQKATFSPTSEQSLKSIIDLCAAENIQLFLLNPPQLCEEVFEKPKVMKGLRWIEGNEWPLAKVDTLYYDDHHLRGVGAELYSEWLAEQLTKFLE